MKKVLVFVTSVCAVVSGIADSLDSKKTFKISGEYFAVESNLPEGTVAATADEAETADFSEGEVVVSYQSTNENGETETFTLVSGKFVDGKVSLIGEIEQPTDILISVKAGGSQELSLQAVVIPGSEEVSFALLDFESFPPDRLAFVGSSKRVKDPSKKFTISGDFNSIDKDLSLANVRITGWGFDENGEQVQIGSGDMLLVDGKFLFEGEIGESDVVLIYIQGHDPYFRSQTQAVVEQGAVITVYSPGSANRIVATAESGRHTRLIESWQQSKEYLATMQEYAIALGEYEAQRANQPLVVDDEVDDDSDAKAADDGNEESSLNEIVNEDNETSKEDLGKAAQTVLAEGCEHVSLKDVKAEIRDLSARGNLPRHYHLSQKLASIESNALQDIAINAEDPFDSLLAMELGAIDFRSENNKEGLAVYDRLAASLDPDIVARRVTTSRDSLASYIEVNDNDKRLVPGQKAPNFRHAALDGKEVALHDVIAEKEIVLVDFWASWCAPCIAKFPKMKEFYSAYGESGFEIVSNSIDSTQEAWELASEEHELPWTSVAEVEGWLGTTARAYGVQHLPKSFLLDSKGCIIQKDLAIEDLEQVLTAHFGDVPELNTDESSVDPDS